MKKKICFVVSAVGTARAFLKDHIERLSSDYDVYLVANYKDDIEIAGLSIAGSKSIRIERRPNIVADLKALKELKDYFREMRFDAVQSQASKPSLLTAIAAFLAHIPVRIRIFTGQIWCNMTGLKRFAFKTMDRLTVALDTHLLADGYPQMRYLIEQKIVKPEKIKVLGNGSICGVDVSRFNPTAQMRSSKRSELGYTDENVVFSFLGRLKREKGISEILAAFEMLYVKHPEARLLLLGGDEENCRSWMPGYPGLNGVSPNPVIFYGFTSEPYNMLQAADVFVLPSYREGFGMSVLEASCLELPVICSDIYGMADTLEDGVTGLKCKVRSAESLYECMERMLVDPEYRVEMGRNGRRRVAEVFPKELVTQAWADYYNELIGL